MLHPFSINSVTQIGWHKRPSFNGCNTNSRRPYTPTKQRYRPLRQLITSCYLSVICRKTGARRHCSGGQVDVYSATILNKQHLSMLLCIASLPPRPASHQLAAEVVQETGELCRIVNHTSGRLCCSAALLAYMDVSNLYYSH